MMWNTLKLNEVNLGLRSDSRRITIFVVYLSLLLDNVLLTMIGEYFLPCHMSVDVFRNSLGNIR